MKYLVLSLGLLFLTACHNSPSLNNSQNALDYVDARAENIPLLNSVQTQKNYKNFLNHYFSIWDVKSNQNGIVIIETNGRLSPTDLPKNSVIFDDDQASHLAVGLPVKIMPQTAPNHWSFVLTAENPEGYWVHAKAIAKVNKSFISQWQKNLGYAEVKSNQKYPFRMGEIYPVYKTTRDSTQLEIPENTSQNYAAIKIISLHNKDIYKIPLLSTPRNFALVSNQFVKMPYDWGGKNGFYDCSSTTKAIYSYFGIWLPRNSENQKNTAGKLINLANLTDSEKQNILLKSAKPYLSLIYFPGHIMMYLTPQNHQLYILHSIWSLKTFFPFQNMIIAKTVITPITWGQNYIYVKKSLLTKATDLIILGVS